MDNYYYNKEVFQLTGDIDILKKRIEELRNMIKKQEDTIEYQKFMFNKQCTLNTYTQEKLLNFKLYYKTQLN